MTGVPGLIVALLSPLINAFLLSRRDVSVFVLSGRTDDARPVDALTRDRAAALLPGSLRLHVSTLPATSAQEVLVCAHAFIHDGSAERDVAAAYREAHGEDEEIHLLGSRPQRAEAGMQGRHTLAWVLDNDSSLLVVTLASRSAEGDARLQYG